MSNKEDILSRYRANIKQRYDMPSLDDIKGITYPDPLTQFITMSQNVGGKVVELQPGQDLNNLVRDLYPEAKEIASNLPEITIATRNPDIIDSAQALNNTEKVACFISENLVILLKKSEIVNNMHEAYRRVEFNDYGYGVFISGPSKTADIAQVLVMGAQAARSVTVVLIP